MWAATGPALEAYSKHPIVKKANAPGELMTVTEFLSHVRRMVVDFVVGQVLTGEKGDSDMARADRMDAPTAYYLLHRHDFGIDDAPAGGLHPLRDCLRHFRPRSGVRLGPGVTQRWRCAQGGRG